VGIYGSNSGIIDVYVGRCRASYDVIIRGVSLHHPRVLGFISSLIWECKCSLAHITEA